MKFNFELYADKYHFLENRFMVKIEICILITEEE